MPPFTSALRDERHSRAAFTREEKSVPRGPCRPTMALGAPGFEIGFRRDGTPSADRVPSKQIARGEQTA